MSNLIPFKIVLGTYLFGNDEPVGTSSRNDSNINTSHELDEQENNKNNKTNDGPT